MSSGRPTSGSTASVRAYTDGVTLQDVFDRHLLRLGVGEGERIGIACSGGADSVALLHLASRAALEPVVLHIDHGLRPDSRADADFVKALASELGLEVRGVRVVVDKTHPSGPEAAAREVRYAALEREASDLGLRWVATGHTCDDQAETVLLRSIRGGSLAAIAPVRGIFVRPLLDVDRVELREWLSAEGLAWREDPTNTDVRLERNWIRAEVMPLLRERRPGVVDVLARLADRARDDEEALDALASEVVERTEVDDIGLLVRTEDIGALPAALFHRVVRGALRKSGVDPRMSDIESVVALRLGGRTMVGPASVWRLDEGLAVVREPVPVPSEQELPRDGTLDAEPWGVRLRLGPSDAPAWRWRCSVPEEAGPLLLRPRHPGDRVRTKAGSKKVQDVLVDAKVPRPLRDLVPVVAIPEKALAVVGLTSSPERASLVIDVEPAAPTWSKRSPWTRANG